MDFEYLSTFHCTKHWFAGRAGLRTSETEALWRQTAAGQAKESEPAGRWRTLRALTDRWVITMPASDQGIAGAVCGKWTPRKNTACARGPGYGGPCATPEAMSRARQRFAERIAAHGRTVDPAAQFRWNQAYRLVRYGLTREQFDRLLEIQQYACAMCHAPFEDAQPIFIDHDHACCPDEKCSCGKCVRGLVCLSCNTALGLIERKYELARAYLDSPPGRLVVVAA